MPTAHYGEFETYYDIEGSGPPLVMYHGLTGTGQRWKDTGYAEALAPHFTLLLIDARGHGRSSKPHDAVFCTRHDRGQDVLAVLNHAGYDQAAFWGHSLGGMVGFTLGFEAPERITRLVLTGYNPFPMEAPEAAEVQSWIDGLRGGMESFVSGYESAHGVLDPSTRAKWLANDHQALIASMEAWVSGSDGTQAKELPEIVAPTMVLVGTEEPFFTDVQRAVATMPNASFVPLPGFDHVATFLRSDVVLPHALPFLLEG